MTAHEQNTRSMPTVELLDTLGMRDRYERGREFLSSATALEAEATRRLDQLADEIQRGLWHNQRKLLAFGQARQHHALRAKDPERYIAACGGQFDLPLELSPILRDHAVLPTGAGKLALLHFFDNARNVAGVGPAFWTLSMLREAELHLYDIFAAEQRLKLRALWQPLLETLRRHAQLLVNPAGSDGAYLLVLDMLFELGELNTFEAIYDEFRSRHANSELFPWPSDASDGRYTQALLRLLDQLITVKRLRNRADDPVLAELLRLRLALQAREAGSAGGATPTGAVLGEDAFDNGGAVDKGPVDTGTAIPAAPAVLPTPNTLNINIPSELTLLKRRLKRTLAALTGGSALAHQRSAVLGFWLAFLCRQSFDLQESQAALSDLAGSEARTLLQLSLRGELAHFTGDFETAQLCLGGAIELAQRLLKRFQNVSRLPPETAEVRSARLFLGQLYQWHGNASMSLGDFTQASNDYAQVDEYLRNATPEAQLTQAVNQGNLAFLSNNLIDYRGYVTYNGEEIARLLGDEDPAMLLQRKYERNREALDDADGHYRAAQALLPNIRGAHKRRRWQAIVNANRANIAWARARLLADVGRLSGVAVDELASHYHEARELYYKAYTAAKQLEESDRPLAAACLANAGELSMLLGDWSAAESASFESLRLLGYSIHNDFDDLLDVEQEISPDQSWRIYLTLARVYEARGKQELAEHTTIRGRPDQTRRAEVARVQRAQARRAYDRALATVESLRCLIHRDDWQVTALQSKLHVFECAMHFFYHAAEVPDAGRIFELSEQLKGRALLDLLESTRLNLDALVPKELRRKQKRLDRRYAQLTQARRLASDADLAQLDRKARQLDAERSRISRKIAEAQRLGASEICPQPLSWKECQRFLTQQPDTILLSFTIGDDHSYLLVGDATALDAFELPGRAAIEALVARLLVYASAKGERRAFEFAAINRAVVDMLLGPAIEKAKLLERIRGKRIVILPDGILYYLPFELLLVRQPVDARGPLDFETYRTLDPLQEFVGGRKLCHDLLPFYLLHDGPISYAHSASVWHSLQLTQADQPEHTALGVYNIRYDTKLPEGPGYTHAQELQISFGDLSHTARVARVLDGFGGDSVAILRLSAEPSWPRSQQSTEANFKRSLKDTGVRYVIFAGHGVYNDKYPQFSGIVFNMPGRRARVREDGFFGLQDIFDLRMPRTELVFLAACQSGLGMISRGEGVNALTRAFMYRGSPSVIASLWSVIDEPTIDLVELFFERLRAQPDTDKATLLQQAKQALCARSGEYAHPRKWAAFVLMGRR
jgi:hypothetical protein